MDRDFWLERWREGRLGFHEGRPNAFLSKHIKRLGSSRTVLMPLCGKAKDILFLAQHGHQVVGVELAEQAIRDFFAENQLTPRIHDRGGFKEYEVESIRLLVGDIFNTTPELIGPVNALYDRAALIALPSELRQRYVLQVLSLLAPHSEGLLVALEYEPSRMSGPPFPVGEKEISALYQGCRISVLEEATESGSPRLRAMDLPVLERCYAVAKLY